MNNKTGFSRYQRWCTRCGKLYFTVAKRGKICPDCNRQKR